jgi:hypothetical protein
LYFVHKCFLQFIPLRENDIGSDQENVVARWWDLVADLCGRRMVVQKLGGALSWSYPIP